MVEKLRAPKARKMRAPALLHVVSNEPLPLAVGQAVSVVEVQAALNAVNEQLVLLQTATRSLAFDVFEALDFRMLSGLIGEMAVSKLAQVTGRLKRNPNIDGYPDLLNATTRQLEDMITDWSKSEPARFLNFPHGGIEVKNTFGTKNASRGKDLQPGQTRVTRINTILDWKAHHQYTRNLLGLLSDFVDGTPQVVAAFHSDNLLQSDWKTKANPRVGSTMTSFTSVTASGFQKLKRGVRVCVSHDDYEAFCIE
jgi:hypothetical protein